MHRSRDDLYRLIDRLDPQWFDQFYAAIERSVRDAVALHELEEHLHDLAMARQRWVAAIRGQLLRELLEAEAQLGGLGAGKPQLSPDQDFASWGHVERANEWGQVSDPALLGLLNAREDDEPLSDAERVAIEEAEADVRAGRVRPWSEVERELEAGVTNG